MRALPIGLLLLSCVSLVALNACGKKAEREWTAADHDRLDETPSGPQQPQPARSQGPAAQAPAANNASDVYRSTCAPCHGATGRGDGPAGKAVRAPDLISVRANRTDEQMANVIKNGRGQMPAYGSFSPDLVNGLVKEIRSFK